MLVSKLYGMFSGNTPKPERSVLKHCPGGGDGIWDVLGYYDPKSYTVTICELEVENYSWEIARSLGLTVFYTRLVLKELVRLHEHAHSLTHTGKFDEFRGNKHDLPEEMKLRCRFRMRYPIKSEINEPIAEFISWSTIQNIPSDAHAVFEKVFDEVNEDPKTPALYRRWSDLKKLLAELSDNEGKPAEDDYICFIPGLIHIARDGVWSGFEDFIQGIQDGFEHLKRWYILLRASKAIL
jgi:hypothetical protein